MGKWLSILAIFAAFGFQTSYAANGPGGSSGGDPQVIEFLTLGDQITAWLRNTIILSEIDRSAFQRQIIVLRKSLDAPNRTPLLVFSDHHVICGGVPKAACTGHGHVTVDRKLWMSSDYNADDDKEKYELITQEVLVLMGHLKNRYTIGEEIGKHASDIAFNANYSSGIQVYNITGTSAGFRSPRGTIRIIGGMAGPDCSNNGTVTTTCNSCANQKPGTACPNSQTLPDGSSASWPFCACNTDRVSDNTVVQIEFNSHSAGMPAIEAGTIGNFFTGTSNSGYGEAGAPMFIEFTWAQLCQAVFGQTSCENVALNSTGLINLGVIDTSATTTAFTDSIGISVTVAASAENQIADCSRSDGGICAFRAYPSNGAVYLENIQTSSGFTPAQTPIIRVFGSKQGFDKANPIDASVIHDLSIENDGSIKNNFIGNMTNGSTYYFRLAMVDVAGNLFSFTSDYNINSPKFGECHARTPATTDPDLKDNCNYRAVPASLSAH